MFCTFIYCTYCVPNVTYGPESHMYLLYVLCWAWNKVIELNWNDILNIGNVFFTLLKNIIQKSTTHIKNNYAAQNCRLYIITCGIQNILTESYRTNWLWFGYTWLVMSQQYLDKFGLITRHDVVPTVVEQQYHAGGKLELLGELLFQLPQCLTQPTPLCCHLTRRHQDKLHCNNNNNNNKNIYKAP